MPTFHRVQQGDCFSSIAGKYGFVNYTVIYNHPRNAALKQKRPNPNLLFPGDIVFVPDKEDKQESRSTGRLHAFVAPAAEALLRIILEDEDGNPVANKRYLLTIDGKIIKGCSDGKGMIEQKIPPDADDAELRIWLSDADASSTGKGFVFPLELGNLDPVEEASGVQARLNNLGFSCGRVDGVIGRMTKSAIESFQEHHRLEVTGELNTATRNRLREVHDGN